MYLLYDLPANPLINGCEGPSSISVMQHNEKCMRGFKYAGNMAAILCINRNFRFYNNSTRKIWQPIVEYMYIQIIVML